MRLTVNGEGVELEAGATVAQAVAAAGVADGDARGVAVAVEGEVLTRADWQSRELREGESVEVVRAVQGG